MLCKKPKYKSHFTPLDIQSKKVAPDDNDNKYKATIPSQFTLKKWLPVVLHPAKSLFIRKNMKA